MARFQSVRALCAIDQRIAIALLDTVIGKILFGEHRIQFGIFINREIPDQRGCEYVEIACRGVLFGIGPACRIAENRVFHAELAGHVIHFLGKAVLGAGNALCNGDGRVVSGLYNHTVKQVADRHFLADFDEGLRSALAPCFLGNQESVIE